MRGRRRRREQPSASARPRLAPAALCASLVLLAGAVGGCGIDAASTGSSSVPGKLAVVATTTQLGDIVRNIGGPAVDVHQLLQPNSDPHEYEPRPADAQAAAEAKVAVMSGDGLDRWMNDVIDESGGDPERVTIAPAHTPDRLAGHGADEHSAYDPHWWHDPRNVEAAIPVIAAALARADPAHRATYERNARAYRAKVRRLDRGIARCMAAIPPAKRKLVTSHDAFGYFARRYHVDVVGAVIESQTTEAQPSAGEIDRLAAQVRAEHVRAIYPESSINPKLAQALARETGARSDLVLYGDTLGPAGSNGDTYLKMEQANADAMVQGMSGGKQRCRIAGI